MLIVFSLVFVLCALVKVEADFPSFITFPARKRCLGARKDVLEVHHTSCLKHPGVVGTACPHPRFLSPHVFHGVQMFGFPFSVATLCA